MRVSARIEPIDRDIAVLLGEELSPEAQSKVLAQFARTSLYDAQQQNRQVLGRVPPHETFVDGRESDVLEAVRPDGTIVFLFEAPVSDLIEWVAEQLVRHSPFVTGRYAASHALFADNVEVPAGAPVPAAEEYAFVNSAPYARKIERGQGSADAVGVYQAVAMLARARFGNVARVTFSYRSLPGGAVGGWAAKTKMQRRGSAVSRRDWLTRQPAIVIRVGR